MQITNHHSISRPVSFIGKGPPVSRKSWPLRSEKHGKHCTQITSQFVLEYLHSRRPDEYYAIGNTTRTIFISCLFASVIGIRLIDLASCMFHKPFDRTSFRWRISAKPGNATCFKVAVFSSLQCTLYSNVMLCNFVCSVF